MSISGYIGLAFILSLMFATAFYATTKNSCPVVIGDAAINGAVIGIDSHGSWTENCRVKVRLNDGSVSDWIYAFEVIK